MLSVGNSSLTPEKQTLFRSLETVPGKFSEALLDTPTGAGVIRVVLPPMQYWLTTSNDAERRYLDAQCRVHGSLEAALAHAAATYPRGLAGLPNADVALIGREGRGNAERHGDTAAAGARRQRERRSSRQEAGDGTRRSLQNRIPVVVPHDDELSTPACGARQCHTLPLQWLHGGTATHRDP